MRGSVFNNVPRWKSDPGKAAFEEKVTDELKAKLEEKELDSLRDVRGTASTDPGMQARQAAEGDKADQLERLAQSEVKEVRGASRFEESPNPAKIAAFIDAKSSQS